ncbi:MAG TPA: hypothetical protein VNU25_02185 [Candidatus Paceibacterota bacterium]|nr:hypothetical protein [Candidatus Paceibacterota bacterium]
MGTTSEPSINFLNVEYFFRLFYELITSPGGMSLELAGLMALAANLWLLVTGISILVSIGLLAVFIHATIRYHETRREEVPKFATVHAAHAEEERDHSRWAHVVSLISSPHESDWRQAIIEADIMLDDLLSQLGYVGESVGEKLKAVDPDRFHTLQNAWDAHKVRNEIAHSGSAFRLEEHTAHRTIALYESVMREHGEI